MWVKTTPLSVDRQKVDSIARRKGGFLGRMIVRSPYIGSTLEYVPAYLVSFDFEGNPLSLLGKRSPPRQGIIQLVADGETMRIGVLEQAIRLGEEDVPPETIDAPAMNRNEEEMVDRALRLARRAVILRYRISPDLKHRSTERFYRPKWVSAYGMEGRVTHTLVTSADNFRFIR